MGQVVIRQATFSDLALVQKLTQDMLVSDSHYDNDLISEWAQTKEAKEFYKKSLSDKKSGCLLAEIEGETVGFAMGECITVQKFRPIKRSELISILVDQRYRGRGIGERLLEEFIFWSKSKGVERVVLSVVYDNKNAIGFYNKRMFEPIRLILEKKI